MDEIQIVFALAVLYVTYRWWSRPGSSAPGSTTSSSSSSQGTPNERLNNLARDSIPPSHIAQVQAMFPQLNEREIKWEFVRTGRVRNVEQVVQFFLDSPPSPVSVDFLRIKAWEESYHYDNVCIDLRSSLSIAASLVPRTGGHASACSNKYQNQSETSLSDRAFRFTEASTGTRSGILSVCQ